MSYLHCITSTRLTSNDLCTISLLRFYKYLSEKALWESVKKSHKKTLRKSRITDLWRDSRRACRYSRKQKGLQTYCSQPDHANLIIEQPAAVGRLAPTTAAGLPVVATDISGNRDIVQDDKNGLLIPPADHTQLSEAVLCLLASEGYRNRMGAKAKEVANQYQWIEIARQYLQVYDEAQNRKRDRSL